MDKAVHFTPSFAQAADNAVLSVKRQARRLFVNTYKKIADKNGDYLDVASGVNLNLLIEQVMNAADNNRGNHLVRQRGLVLQAHDYFLRRQYKKGDKTLAYIEGALRAVVGYGRRQSVTAATSASLDRCAARADEIHDIRHKYANRKIYDAERARYAVPFADPHAMTEKLRARIKPWKPFKYQKSGSADPTPIVH